MELRNSEMPCKIRKRRFTTASSSSFANNNLSQFLVEKTDSPRNEKCISRLNRSTCKEEGLETMALQKSGADNRVINEVFEKSITNVDRSRNKSRSSPGRVHAPEVINPHYRYPGMEKNKSLVAGSLTYGTKPLEGKSRIVIETETKNYEHPMLKPIHGLNEIKHSLTLSKELLKLLTHIWTANTNHNHPTTLSLASTLNHELNKARSHVNKLIQEQQSNNIFTCEYKDQDKIRFAVKTISRELETERKLRRQTERMNKKLGRELANTKSSLEKAIKNAESEKQATKILEELCEKLKKESERVREEIEEEREMLRVADMLREERVQMKLVDAKYEYEDKHKQVNILVHDLEELLEADNNDNIDPLKRTPKENDKGKMVNDENDENTLGDDISGYSWYENKGEVVNEVIGRNSDCIEWEFGLAIESEDSNRCLEERVLGFSFSSTMKEYEDEMERYKMIKDLRDRIVSGGSDLSRDTIEFGSYT